MSSPVDPADPTQATVRSERHARHALIDWFSQDRVRSARIAVIGAGAVGNEVVKNLALLGVGRIDVFDFDRVELHNLTRSIFLRESDVGAAKALAVATHAATVDPALAIRGFDGDFRDRLSLSELARYDGAIAAVDNFEARLALSEMCFLAGTNLVNAGIDSRRVVVESFPFRDAPGCACYECHLPESAYQRIAERYSCGGLRRAAKRERLVPTTAITASVAGALAVSAALRLGPETTRQAQRVFFDTLAGQATSTLLEPHLDCAGCAPLRPRPHLVRARNRWSAAPGSNGDVVASVRTSEPLIVDCRCAACGDRSVQQRHGLQRARAFDDRIATCTACIQPAVQIEIRDRFDLAEVERLFGDRPLPVGYVIVTHASGTLCIDLQETRDDQ